MPSRRKTLHLTRRQFVVAGAASGTLVAIGCSPAKQAAWEFLTEDQARTLAAICDEIVPADEFPSASQAGAVNYIDRQLTRHYRRHRDAYREGLERVARLSKDRFGKELADLTPAQRLQVVQEIERGNRSFFELVRNHTMEGYYGTPRHGGNRDEVSWRMLGLPDPPLRGQAKFDLRKGSPS